MPNSNELKIKIDFFKYKKTLMFVTICTLIASFLLICTKGINASIDFTGGSLIEYRFKKDIKIQEIRKLLAQNNITDIIIQNMNNNNTDILIRVGNISTDSTKEDLKQISILKNIIQNEYKDVEVLKIDYVGPQFDAEIIESSIFAVILSLCLMFIYIWSRFNWRFALGGIIALLHDVLITFGFASLLGVEFNASSIAAILTIIGYSINDSVVIFDRIRENLRKYRKSNFKDIVNYSTNNTLSRTVLTAGTTLVAILSLILFGGSVLYSFSILLFIGVIIGTYSSIYIATIILMINRNSIK